MISHLARNDIEALGLPLELVLTYQNQAWWDRVYIAARCVFVVIGLVLPKNG